MFMHYVEKITINTYTYNTVEINHIFTAYDKAKLKNYFFSDN